MSEVISSISSEVVVPTVPKERIVLAILSNTLVLITILAVIAVIVAIILKVINKRNKKEI